MEHFKYLPSGPPQLKLPGSDVPLENFTRKPKLLQPPATKPDFLNLKYGITF
jgi:hypothetical protein